nr:MAG TPA: hypothetical protein [Caudoviricetes sp.]
MGTIHEVCYTVLSQAVFIVIYNSFVQLFLRCEMRVLIYRVPLSASFGYGSRHSDIIAESRKMCPTARSFVQPFFFKSN